MAMSYPLISFPIPTQIASRQKDSGQGQKKDSTLSRHKSVRAKTEPCGTDKKLVRYAYEVARQGPLDHLD